MTQDYISILERPLGEHVPGLGTVAVCPVCGLPGVRVADDTVHRPTWVHTLRTLYGDAVYGVQQWQQLCQEEP